MNTNTLAAGLVGFLLGGLTVSVAAQLEDDQGDSPHGAPAPHSIVHSVREAIEPLPAFLQVRGSMLLG